MPTPFVKHLIVGLLCISRHVNILLNRLLWQRKLISFCVTFINSGTKRMQQRKGSRSKGRGTVQRPLGKSLGQTAKRWMRTHKCVCGVCVNVCMGVWHGLYKHRTEDNPISIKFCVKKKNKCKWYFSQRLYLCCSGHVEANRLLHRASSLSKESNTGGLDADVFCLYGAIPGWVLCVFVLSCGCERGLSVWSMCDQRRAGHNLTIPSSDGPGFYSRSLKMCSSPFHQPSQLPV